jgi:hypothetical protein
MKKIKYLIISVVALVGFGVYWYLKPAKIDPLIGFTSFNAGQVSPLLDARNDFPKYNTACRTLENMFVTVQGPAMRRPGTKMITEVKDSNYPVRLIPFESTTGDTYIIEAGNRYMRFYTTGARIMDDSDPCSQYEISTPFTTADLNNLQCAQGDNQMYIVDGNHVPQILTRFSGSNWSCSDVTLLTGPFLPENDTTITITPSGYDGNNVVLHGVYSASNNSSYAHFAFDGVVTNNDGWHTSNTNVWIEVNIPVAKTVTRVRIQPFYSTLWPAQNVRHCKIEASADDSTWVKLPVNTYVNNCKAYEVNEIEISQIGNFTDWAEVVLTNSTPYKFYRIYCYDGWNVQGAVALNEIQMFEGITTLTASSNIFDTNIVGSIWQISQSRGDQTIIKGSLDSDTCDVCTPYFTGGYSFTTSGTWKATVILQRSTDDGATWNNALSPLNSVNYNNPTETEMSGAIYRVSMSDRTSGTCNYTFIISDQYNHGVVKITSVTSPTEANVMILTPLWDTSSTTHWREGYWSDYRGWPQCIEFHQQRLVFAASKMYPQTIWFGKANPDDYLNFTEGILDTDSFIVAFQGHNIIRWLLSQDLLFIGTSESMGKYGDTGKSITPTSPSYREQSKAGSAPIKAVLAGDGILYIERGNRKVREIAYNLAYDKYLAPDLTVLSDNITLSGVRDIAFQVRPQPTLWCVLNDGNMATLTYYKDQEIIGWSKQITQGSFESVTRIPSNTEDEVWVEVLRGSHRYIEQFQPIDWGTDQNNCWFVDSGLSYSGVSKHSFTGLNHLASKRVSVYADGNALSDANVTSGGVLTTDVNGSNVVAGLSYTSKLETMPIVIGSPMGTSAAMNSKIVKVDFDLLNSGYCRVKMSSGGMKVLDLSDPYHLTGRQNLCTSTVSFNRPNISWDYIGGNCGHKSTIYVESDRPQPLCIRGIYPFIEVSP